MRLIQPQTSRVDIITYYLTNRYMDVRYFCDAKENLQIHFVAVGGSPRGPIFSSKYYYRVVYVTVITLARRFLFTLPFNTPLDLNRTKPWIINSGIKPMTLKSQKNRLPFNRNEVTQ